jgi:rhodanese-related sulfurtransferase
MYGFVIVDFQQGKFVNFIFDNIFLICIALFSAGSLLMPYLRQSANISHLDATKMINKGKVAILDIRDLSEFRTGHLRNSLHIPLSELPNKLAKLEKFQSQPVIVVCKSGTRSSTAISQLKQAGFKEVYNLEGGIESWQQKGLPTTM